MNPLHFYKCLADETRLRCMLLIQQEGELCVCELMAALQEAQPKVSRHLAQLRKSGLLKDRRQGQWVFYCIESSLPQWALDVLIQTTEANTEFLMANLQQLSEFGDRPQRISQCC